MGVHEAGPDPAVEEQAVAGESSPPIVSGSSKSAVAYGLPRSSAGRRTTASRSWPCSRRTRARPMLPVAPVITIMGTSC
ncbi:hypothetical protein ACFQ0B_35390 [Nonomuraea thailandensis]